MRSIVLLSSIMLLNAQNFQAKAQTRKGLSVGDQVSNITINNLINYPKPSLKLSELNGKGIILDFWAPWCSPCLTILPKLDSLQMKYATDIHILPITTESKEFSEKVLNNIKSLKNLKLNYSAVEDTSLSRLFRHKVLPHYIWIDKYGVVKAITGSDEITQENVNKLIIGEELDLPLKTDKRVAIDEDKPVFAGNQVRVNNELSYHSMLTNYIQGVAMAARRGSNWVTCTNHPINMLYAIALGKFNLGLINHNRWILEGFETSADSLLIGYYTVETRKAWREVEHKNTYNYELFLPDSTFTFSEMFQLMHEDLNRVFRFKGIQAHLQKREVKTLVLTRLEGNDKFITKGGPVIDRHSDYYLRLQNRPFSSFVGMLQSFFTNGNALPIQDETGYAGNMDIELNCNLSDIKALNRELQKFGLNLIKTTRSMDMVVFSKTRTLTGTQ